MTEVELLEQIRFCAHVTAFAASWLAGCVSLKFLIYFKNHRDLW